MSFQKKVYAFIHKFNMLSPEDLVLVGVSGGPDSVALLHVLWSMREELQISLAVAHLNHMFRGEEARTDARMVEELAATLGLPVYVEQFDVPAYRERTGMSAQEAARKVRYQFFEHLARQLEASRVALGHHADDQAETILLNFLRGSGLSGLKGIPPIRHPYIRPLLDVRRREIAAYCRHHRLPVREDASNRKPIYTRNRIRLQLIPSLEQGYNPRLVNALVNLGHICREEDAYLEEEAERVYEREVKEEGRRLAFPVDGLLSCPVALRRRVLRRAWCRMTGAKRDLSCHQVEALLGLLESSAGGKNVVLPRGVRAAREGPFLRLWTNDDAQPVPFYCYPLVVPGITYIAEIDKSIFARVFLARDAGDPRQLSRREALLDYETIPGPMMVRRRMEGDRFRPLGLAGTTKLKKFLINHRIPREERDRLPLVVAGDDILWVGGLRLAEPFKVTGRTRKCLYLQMIDGRPGRADWAGNA